MTAISPMSTTFMLHVCVCVLRYWMCRELKKLDLAGIAARVVEEETALQQQLVANQQQMANMQMNVQVGTS